MKRTLTLQAGRHGLALVYFAGLIVWEVRDGARGDLLGTAVSLLTMGYLCLITSSYLRRGLDTPLSRGDGTAQAAAVLGANLLIPLTWLPVRFPETETVAVVTSMGGLGLSFWAAWHLGTAFSIVPEARRLVRSGPYRWVRHPLYLAGFVIGLGLLLANFSPAALGFFVAFAACQCWRLGCEERVLAGALPEYRDYRRRTWALLPHVY